MPPLHEDTSGRTARTAFLRTTERQDVAGGIGLAKLAMWYADENVPFEDSVAALADRAGDDLTTVRVAYEVLGFGKLGHSTHTQVAALFMVNDLRVRMEGSGRPTPTLPSRLVAAMRRLRGR